jgi:hypothetical protein
MGRRVTSIVAIKYVAAEKKIVGKPEGPRSLGRRRRDVRTMETENLK